MRRLYFAAPLFSAAELAFNERLAGLIEGRGISVFLPQRDGVDRSAPPYDAMSETAIAEAIFTQDRNAVLACDLFLFVLDGRVPDEGAAVELGIAHMGRRTTGRPAALLGLMTDVRGGYREGPLNPMLSAPLDMIFTEEADLLRHLAERHAP